MLLFYIVDILFQVYFFFILARVIGSWVPELQNTKLMQFVVYYTDPYLNFFKKFIPPIGMIDISVIVAVVCLWVLEIIVKKLIILLLI